MLSSIDNPTAPGTQARPSDQQPQYGSSRLRPQGQQLSPPSTLVRKFMNRRERSTSIAAETRRKAIEAAGKSLGLDCDMESNKTSGPDAPAPYDDGLAAFMSVRPRLFGIAYRMLHSPAEAEDIVQDVWVRWQTADRLMVRDAAAFLVTTVTRLAINVVQSARSRRETHVPPWLPEPIDTSADPGSGAERGEELELGVLLLLERLSPAERTAYILREAFDYAYHDIANVLRLEEANARQVVTRARRRVANGRRMSASSTEHRRLLDSFTAAAQCGQIAALERLLASNVVSTSARAVAA